MTPNNNLLWPVFFRLDKLRLLIVGAGTVGHEKLHFILKSSPNARITVIANAANTECLQIFEKFKNQVHWIQKEIESADICNFDMIISATNCKATNLQIYKFAKEHGKICNIADTPDLCDFYMGSIISKGNLKVAISTNGKSPTLAKRMRQILEEVIPNNVGSTIANLKILRDRLKGDFEYKVNELNRITASLVNQEKNQI